MRMGSSESGDDGKEGAQKSERNKEARRAWSTGTQKESLSRDQFVALYRFLPFCFFLSFFDHFVLILTAT